MPNIKYMVRSWCNKLRNKDVICLQVIKVNEYHTFNILKFVWDKAKCLYLGYQRGKGGVVLLINPKWVEKIVSNFYSPCHRTIGEIFNINNTFVGIYNIYTSNDYREISLLWDWLVDNLLESNWIFMGDLNMI